jgi:hypothetical protein
MNEATNFCLFGIKRSWTGENQIFVASRRIKTRMRGVGMVGDNDDTHYAYPGRRHHNRAVTSLRLVSLHDGKRGSRQIPQGTSLLAPQRTLLG